MLWAQSTTRDYIRAEGDVPKLIYSWKGQYGRDKTGRTVRKRRAVGWIYGMKYSWNGRKDRKRQKNRIKRSGQAQLVYDRHKPQRPHHVKVSPWGPSLRPMLTGFLVYGYMGRNQAKVWTLKGRNSHSKCISKPYLLLCERYLNPEREEFTLKMHLKAIFIAVWKISESWNPAVAWEVQPMLIIWRGLRRAWLCHSPQKNAALRENNPFCQEFLQIQLG